MSAFSFPLFSRSRSRCAASGEISSLWERIFSVAIFASALSFDSTKGYRADRQFSFPDSSPAIQEEALS